MKRLSFLLLVFVGACTSQTHREVASDGNELPMGVHHIVKSMSFASLEWIELKGHCYASSASKPDHLYVYKWTPVDCFGLVLRDFKFETKRGARYEVPSLILAGLPTKSSEVETALQIISKQRPEDFALTMLFIEHESQVSASLLATGDFAEPFAQKKVVLATARRELKKQDKVSAGLGELKSPLDGVADQDLRVVANLRIHARDQKAMVLELQESTAPYAHSQVADLRDAYNASLELRIEKPMKATKREPLLQGFWDLMATFSYDFSTKSLALQR
jgi:hypothetical protein